MHWTFKIHESSAGVYSCEGIRSIGNTVSLVCVEDEIFKVYRAAYELESSLGTPAGRAAYLVVEGAKPTWTADYSEKTFGSWVVSKPGSNACLVFDGRDSILMAFGSENAPILLCRVEESEPPTQEFFEFLFRA